MLKHLIFLLFILTALQTLAQSDTAVYKASITVLNEANKPLDGATAVLIQTKDSAIVKTSISNEAGLAEFENVASGKYIIRITMVNYTAIPLSFLM